MGPNSVMVLSASPSNRIIYSNTNIYVSERSLIDFRSKCETEGKTLINLKLIMRFANGKNKNAICFNIFGSQEVNTKRFINILNRRKVNAAGRHKFWICVTTFLIY